ncbi:MAG TPA: MucR family transcriptional regulator [Aliidongia sp.]|uniref:MucR family transcriptional regulator n=1 Tax=Aliidongia sp. TaxID=1914230 RepID=UPI002DDCA331|nr:MucR family transcriptional regulator [Aliidongia sp.]HEV2674731.1 MucR family transcriptional regulator [Aliidongia sp.]
MSTVETVTRTLGLTAEIVAAFLSNNTVAIADLPNVIQSVHRALSGVAAPELAPVAEKLVPAVPIKKSVTPDYIVCLEDGKKLKMLKRHLSSTYNLTPDEYRAKWGLPPDYPMTAPTYAAQRSSLARSIGLGRKPAPIAEAVPARRPGRPKKSAA